LYIKIEIAAKFSTYSIIDNFSDFILIGDLVEN